MKPSLTKKQQQMIDYGGAHFFEEWRSVSGYRGHYIVSSIGRIFSLKGNRSKILKSSVDANGYVVVGLCRDGVSRSFKAHRIVAAAFLGNSSLQVNHKNGVKTDNRVSNLEWATSRQNVIHSHAMGLVPKGEKHRWAKLSDNQVLEIRRSKESTKTLRIRYSVSRSCIQMIRRGDQRKDV